MKLKYKGLTLIEMAVSIAVGLIIILAVGVVLVGGERGWQNLYNSIHNPMRYDADKFTITFTILGRKSNRIDYRLYTVTDEGNFQQAIAGTNNEETVLADAVEFVYWDVPFDASDSHNLLDTEKLGTAYALIYPQDGKLKIDYGSYPPSAINGISKRSADRTEILVENLTFAEFSHTTVSKVGRGCVRATVEITDPETNESMTIKAATLMRNIWPR